TAYAVRPAGPAFAPVRLALVRSAVLVGAGAAVAVEALSAAHELTRPALVVLWSVGSLAALVPAIRRYAAPPALPSLRPYLLVLPLLGLFLAELLIALWYPPNNYDSQTYHLPKIEHWVVQRDVSFYPTAIHRQLSMAP